MFLRRIPYQSVQRRRIRHWFLLLMRLAALALIVLAFARPFLRRTELVAGASGRARGRRPARSVVQHGLRREVGAGDRRRAEHHQRPERGRPGIDRPLLVEHRSGAAIGGRQRTAARGDCRRAAGRGGHPLRPGAEARRQHPQRVGAAAPRSDPHHRLSARRLAGGRGRQAARRRGAHAGCDQRQREGQPRGGAGVAAAVGVPEPAARHGDERRGQPLRRRPPPSTSRSRSAAARFRRGASAWGRTGRRRPRSTR